MTIAASTNGLLQGSRGAYEAFFGTHFILIFHYAHQILLRSSLHNQLQYLQSSPAQTQSSLSVFFFFQTLALMLLPLWMAIQQTTLSITELQKICNIFLQALNDISFHKKDSLFCPFLWTVSVWISSLIHCSDKLQDICSRSPPPPLLPGLRWT